MNWMEFPKSLGRIYCAYLLTFSCLSKWGETNHKVSSSAALILRVEELLNSRNVGFFKENMVQSVQR